MTSQPSFPIGEGPFDRIEILQVALTGMFRTDETGECELVPYYVSQPRAVVELINAKGDRQGLWEGIDVQRARQQAAAWSQQLGGVRVIDRTSGTVH